MDPVDRRHYIQVKIGCIVKLAINIGIYIFLLVIFSWLGAPAAVLVELEHHIYHYCLWIF